MCRREKLEHLSVRLLSLLHRFESGKAAFLRLSNLGNTLKCDTLTQSSAPFRRASWRLPFISTTPSLGLYYNYRGFASSHTLHQAEDLPLHEVDVLESGLGGHHVVFFLPANN